MWKNAGAAIWPIRQVSPRAHAGSRSWIVSPITSARTQVSSPARSRIRAYLTMNAAEKWDTRAAHELQGLNPQDPLRLTATPFWIRMHRGIPESVFKSRAVGAKGACESAIATLRRAALIRRTSTFPSELLNESDWLPPDFDHRFGLRACASHRRQIAKIAPRLLRERGESLRPRISADSLLSEASIFSGPISRRASPTHPPARPATRQTQEMSGKPARARTLSRWRPRRIQSVTAIRRKRRNGLDETATTCSAENVPQRKRVTS